MRQKIMHERGSFRIREALVYGTALTATLGLWACSSSDDGKSPFLDDSSGTVEVFFDPSGVDAIEFGDIVARISGAKNDPKAIEKIADYIVSSMDNPGCELIIVKTPDLEAPEEDQLTEYADSNSKAPQERRIITGCENDAIVVPSKISYK